MVSDEDIVNGIESLLHDPNPNPNGAVTSVNGVVRQLEAKLGLDLSHKAGFIRDFFTRIPLALPLNPQPQQQSKDHFAILPQFHDTGGGVQQQFQSSHFALPHPHYHSPPPGELGFRYPPPPPPPQLYHHPYSHPLQQQHQHHLYQQQQQHPLQSPNSHAQPHSVGKREAPAGKPESKKESASAGTKRRGGSGGLNKVCGISPQLQAVLGEPALPRTQIVKQLWAYIRKHNLQDPSNKRKIICNEALRLVFETDCTDMFKMNKLLTKHIIPLDPTKESIPDSKRVKVETESASESTEVASEVAPETASEVTLETASEVTLETASEAALEDACEVALEAAAEVDSSTITISDTLARFFGTEKREMPQSEAVRRIWEYIKVNQLEDHLNPMMIICDSKLQELVGCENISALGIAEMLMSHIFKQL